MNTIAALAAETDATVESITAYVDNIIDMCGGDAVGIIETDAENDADVMLTGWAADVVRRVYAA